MVKKGLKSVMKVDINHVNPFLSATIETFSTMIGEKAVPGKPSLEKGRGIGYDISGVIGLTGDLIGSVSLSFPEDTALNVISAFLGEEVKELDYDAMDAVGELVNIIAGYAKKFLKGYSTSISLPSVIKGAGLVVKEPNDVFSFIVPFKTELGAFDVGVGLKSAK